MIRFINSGSEISSEEARRVSLESVLAVLLRLDLLPVLLTAVETAKHFSTTLKATAAV